MPTATDTLAADLQAAVELFNSTTEQAALIDEASDTASALRARAGARVAELAGGQREAARLLGIGQSTLSKLISKSRRSESPSQDLADAFRRLGATLATANVALKDLVDRMEVAGLADEPDFTEPAALTGRVPEPEPKPS